MDKFFEAKQHGTDMVNTNASLHAMQIAIDKMINMEWDDKPVRKDLKYTMSPEARNQHLGAVRLLTASEPIISVPFDKNDQVSIENSEKIERMCKAILYQSGRVFQKPVHYELVDSLLRYGQFHLAITDTDDLLVANTNGLGKASKARRMRSERISKATPYLFTPLDPKCGNVEQDAFGISAYYRENVMTYAKIKSLFGEVEHLQGHKDTDLLTYKDYWDLDVHYAWVDDMPEPLIGKENNGRHDLPCIPIVVQGAEGFSLQDDSQYRYQPMLYGVWKGELWERYNLELTTMYSNLFAVASNALFVHERTEPDSKLEVDFDNIGGIIHMNPGERITPLVRDVMNKDMLYGLDVVEKLFESSTIYKTALGQGGGSGTAFSTIALLNQAGRLPLIASQRCGGWGIGTGLEAMFQMIKDKRSKRTTLFEGGVIDIDPSDLPDNLIIDVKLDAELPQDKLQQSNIASMLKQQGLASDEWIRENVLNIGQSGDMTKKVMEERFVETMMQEHFTKAMENEIRKKVQEEMMMAMQQQQMQQQAQTQGQQQQMQGQQQQEMMALQEQERMARKDAVGNIEQRRRYKPPQGAEIMNDPNMGGMPPIVAKGAIPATRPGMKPTSANGMPQEIQGGEM